MDMEGNADPSCFPCPAGKYCGEGDATGGTDCDAGFYCKSGNRAPNPEYVDRVMFYQSISLYFKMFIGIIYTCLNCFSDISG